jgi:acetyl esterase
MPLDLQVDAVLERIRAAGGPEYWQMTPQEARDWHNRKAAILDVAPLPVAKSEDRRIAGPEGEIPLRIYTPREAATPLPLIVWLHGGGHVVGSLQSYDALCRTLALSADCLVVSVDHRLAPEHRFPAGVVDSFAALQWTARHAPEFGASDADSSAPATSSRCPGTTEWCTSSSRWGAR